MFWQELLKTSLGVSGAFKVGCHSFAISGERVANDLSGLGIFRGGGQ